MAQLLVRPVRASEKNYCTVSVNAIVRVVPPAVAVTVKEYVFGCVTDDPPPPLPHADIASASISSSEQGCTARVILCLYKREAVRGR